MKIRMARSGDAAMLSELASRTFRDTYAGMCRAEDVELYIAGHFAVDRQLAELIDPIVATLIAEDDGVAVGYAQMRRGVAPPSVVGARPVEMARFYLATPWRGQGVGAALMSVCVEHARLAGATLLWLGVWKRNTRAIAFYERRGFHVVGAQTFQMGTDPQCDHLMARSLDEA